jgi:outer membrane immunogenic protein
MKMFYPALAALAASIALASPAAADDRPNATATFSTHTVAALVRYTWGRGVLKFQGHNYPFKIEGLGAIGIGINKVHGVARVYHLRRVSDFAGSYGKVTAGASIGNKGGESSTMKNDRGVVINVEARERGVQFNAGGGGVHIKLLRR